MKRVRVLLSVYYDVALVASTYLNEVRYPVRELKGLLEEYDILFLNYETKEFKLKCKPDLAYKASFLERGNLVWYEDNLIEFIEQKVTNKGVELVFKASGDTEIAIPSYDIRTLDLVDNYLKIVS